MVFQATDNTREVFAQMSVYLDGRDSFGLDTIKVPCPRRSRILPKPSLQRMCNGYHNTANNYTRRAYPTSKTTLIVATPSANPAAPNTRPPLAPPSMLSTHRMTSPNFLNSSSLTHLLACSSSSRSSVSFYVLMMGLMSFSNACTVATVSSCSRRRSLSSSPSRARIAKSMPAASWRKGEPRVTRVMNR